MIPAGNRPGTAPDESPLQYIKYTLLSQEKKDAPGHPFFLEKEACI
jgi:hypothetical protein